ncbi:ubiquitin thioesterase trabid [Plutella xylostella]|uniref:ubiquitin thioesterase trabid n=1 Tax=Plutella xylostella TaxID=51655 RepID=UPI002032B58A|nr:ubiquitin thioesterase trabid [Plutella xylostella]XP_048486521.1 ubiquitin thioesterase trabid [Plutella xylostella]
MSEEVQDDSNNTASLSLEPAGAECGATEASGAEGGGTADASTNVSQTHIPQMTASPCPDNSGKWNCDFCTYENFPQSRKCTMCRSAKPLLNEDIFRLQDGASALPPPPPDSSVSEAEAVAERLRPLCIASPPAQAGASCVPKWPCPTCTYENWPKSLKCAMCGASSPQPAPRTQVGINDICNSQNASIQDSAELDTARRAKRKTDWLWLQACLGVVEGDISLVHSYLSGGGDPARALTPPEVALLNRASAFDAGHTLVHLAIRFQRQDILSTLLSRISGSGPGLKRSPSYIAPDLASAIRRHIASCIRTKKGPFQCRYINEFCTFSLPAEIEELPPVIQEQLFSELLDRDAQSTLEADPPLINWSRDFNDTLAGTRLYALWNRSLGDCLPDAVSQATYGVSDRERVLRAAAAASLANNRQRFYERWSTWERLQASLLHYTPDESQLLAEWTRLVAPAAAPNTPLHQLHVFALAHVIRRPIIVYGVNVVNSFRGEALGYARFQGVYLPLLWEPEFCSKWPICLGYTRGHFSALVSVEPYSSTRRYICRERPENAEVYLPLTDFEGKLLPVHFLNCEELADTEGVLRRWLSVSGRGASLTARQRLPPRPLLLAQMLEEWLNHYRRTIQQCRGPFPPRLHAAAAAELSSDPDSDEE